MIIRFNFLFLLLLISLVHARAQNSSLTAKTDGRREQPDDYSYLVLICRNDTVFGSGTGFFYNYKGRHLFLTARHNLTGYDHFEKKFIEEGFRCDKILVRVFNRNGEPLYHSVNLETYHEGFDKNEPLADVEIFELNLPATVELKGIEDFVLAQDYVANPPDSIEVRAFSQQELLTKMQLNQVRARPLIGMPGFGIKTAHAVDPAYLKIFPRAEIGYSGAPVFFKYKLGETTMVKFGGLISGSNFQDNYAVILRAEEVERKILNAIDLLNNGEGKK